MLDWRIVILIAGPSAQMGDYSSRPPMLQNAAPQAMKKGAGVEVFLWAAGARRSTLAGAISPTSRRIRRFGAPLSVAAFWGEHVG